MLSFTDGRSDSASGQVRFRAIADLPSRTEELTQLQSSPFTKRPRSAATSVADTMGVTGQSKRPRWLPTGTWPRASRVVRAPRIIILFIISTLLILAIMHQHLLWVLASITGYSSASYPPIAADTGLSAIPTTRLTFAHDGTFKISIFEDLHFGEAEDTDWGPRQDEMTLKVMQGVLEFEGPQLVVLNGDLITGENTMLENATDYIDMIVKPLVRGGHRWASSYGNHDAAFNLSSLAMLEREQRYDSLCLTSNMVAGDDVGTTNYYVPVYGALGDAVPKLILWFFDSQGGRGFRQHDNKGGEIVIPGVVHERVVGWFEATSAGLRAQYGHAIPSLAFVHIPVSAMLDFQKHGVDPQREPGIDDDIPLGSEGPDDSSFVKVLKSTDGLMAVFSGHDHGNDFCHPTPGSPTPFFCFGRHTGYGGYGHWMRGSRQIVLSEATLLSSMPEVETWIRLEDRTESGHVFLNKTYGTDEYPKVDNKKTKSPTPD